MFDVLAIRGENAGRLIPESPEDKLAHFSFFTRGEKISRARRSRACTRARANKAPEGAACIDVKFFLTVPYAIWLFIHLPATCSFIEEVFNVRNTIRIRNFSIDGRGWVHRKQLLIQKQLNIYGIQGASEKPDVCKTLYSSATSEIIFPLPAKTCPKLSF